ncbi:hypothetical protein K8R30_01820 [archaeon]|nr:hypothetical protein [archaeon]
MGNNLKSAVESAITSIVEMKIDKLRIGNVPKSEITEGTLEFSKKAPFKDNYYITIEEGFCDFERSPHIVKYDVVVRKIDRSGC